MLSIYCKVAFIVWLCFMLEVVVPVWTTCSQASMLAPTASEVSEPVISKRSGIAVIGLGLSELGPGAEAKSRNGIDAA